VTLTDLLIWSRVIVTFSSASLNSPVRSQFSTPGSSVLRLKLTLSLRNWRTTGRSGETELVKTLEVRHTYKMAEREGESREYHMTEYQRMTCVSHG